MNFSSSVGVTWTERGLLQVTVGWRGRCAIEVCPGSDAERRRRRRRRGPCRRAVQQRTLYFSRQHRPPRFDLSLSSRLSCIASTPPRASQCVDLQSFHVVRAAVLSRTRENLEIRGELHGFWRNGTQ